MIRRFIKYYRPHWRLLVLDLFCALAVAGIDLLFPVATNRILRELIPNSQIRTMLLVGFFLLVLYGIRFLFSYIIGYYGHVMGIRIETDMRSDLFRKLQVLDYQFFDNKKTGELMTNLTSHLHDVSEMSHHAPEDLFISSLMLMGSFTILMFIEPLLTLIVFVFLLMLVTYSLTRRRKMLNSFRVSRTVQGELNAEIESSISGIRLTKAYNNESYEQTKFEKVNSQYRKARSNIFREIGLYGSGNDFFANLANLAVLIFGGYFVYKNRIDYIDLTTYFLYVNFLIRPIQRLTNSMEQLQQGFSGIEKFYQIMDVEPKIVSKPKALKKSDFIGDIQFKNVEFSYSQDEHEFVLKNFSYEIPAGRKVAIVGETGVGKTTISKLLPRFYDVLKGEIKIDGINVKDYDLYDLRSAIGIIQQDVFIFWGTIKDNILYGRPDATFEEVVEAAKKAQIHDFIMSLEQGYDSLTGERGVKLSGGQQQRISIARLFLKNPKILILDEATSSLDNITENLIQQSFEELAKDKTTIMIAHRLSTIQNADEIIVLGKNGIMERGTHEELVQSGGYYQALYNAVVTI
ncbi:MAG TPA: ABC transporter ATP-binding protein [Bacilli bacterium]|nr:MAG: putative multidrug export ATP-binding/permease protein [Tenericutes bacterium ADurb.BinA124]HNZ49903.1 ABC transporter ATP-binding protein [Bacilli bacterium]HOH17710.1 ABC transporter ATP-binding protein [Bacilli bacterium]HPX84225.1 ABC transporter ATP-binding protein [Bacilli bacterium]HQC74144.1 ABC transporter ATP-binding protein [Bacilli bacterium]